MESEKEGKPIKKIIGQIPKEYMKQLSGEMENDYVGRVKYILITLLGGD